MATNFEKLTKEVLVEKIVNNKEDINDLNLSKKMQKEAFFEILTKRPHLVKKVNEANAKEFLNAALKQNPELFIYFDRTQYTNELAQKYLLHRLENVNEKVAAKNNRKDALLVQKSMDGNIVFLYSYVTPEGDELNYMDNELNIPLSLKSNFKMSLKLDDAVRLIEKLDLDVAQLGENKIRSTIIDLISNQYLNFLSSYIKEHNVGYYTLATSFSELEAGFMDVISDAFTPYGMSVSDFIIKRISIPNDIKNKIEDLAFQIRQRKSSFEADAELERISLANYESKLAVQQRYPEAIHSLTEYEKDLALKRYLVKIGKLNEEEVDRTNVIASSVEVADAEISKGDDKQPEPEKNKFKSRFIMICLLAGFVSVILMIAASLGVGFIALGVSTILLGLFAAKNHTKFNETQSSVDDSE